MAALGPRLGGASRRRALRRLATVLMLGSVLTGLALGNHLHRRGAVALDTSGMTLSATGRQDPAQRLWRRAGRVPAAPEGVPADLVSGALTDLHTLTRPYGVPVAAWSPNWRYVWPRDSAFVASALARTGHPAEARAILGFLQAAQEPDGSFHARYAPDGSGPPDDRGIQVDGTGWSLWALAQVAAEVPAGPERRRLIQDYRRLLDVSTDAVTGWVSAGVPVTADYWEVPERSVTLATAAALLAGLRGAEDLYSALGDSSQVGGVRSVADRLEQVTLTHFDPRGFPRRPGGGPASVDLGVSFLLTPFAGVESDAAERTWRAAPRRMARPAGGLAPGGSWPRDGISWTPTVATYAMVAACRDPAAARTWLGWLAAHRTPNGALPEKVRRDGSPASVAPLAWTAAAVVITADLLERGCTAVRTKGI